MNTIENEEPTSHSLSSKKKIILIIVLALSVLASVVAEAQPVAGQSADKIVAIVGKEIILESDVQANIAILAQQNKQLDINDKAIRQKVLDGLINERLVITKAIEDSVTASDEEITQQLDYTLQGLIQSYGSEKRVEELYGMSIAKIRKDYREEIRKRILWEKIRQQKFSSTKASTREVGDFFTQYSDSIPPVPPQAELAHIVKYVQASVSQKEETLKLALKVRDSILKGGDFADFAKRYSGDGGSSVSGGDLGWVDKGKLVPEYEKAAFALGHDETTQPIETPFGYHIIQTIEKRKDAIHTRHILFKIGRSTDDNERTKNELSALKDRVAKGEKFEDLAKKYSEEKETQGFGGSMGAVELTRLPGELKSIIEALPDGGITDPLPYMADPTKPAFHILQRKVMIPEHKATIDKDSKRIEQIATVYKQNKEFDDWVQVLRKTLYWEVKQ
ncbi:MAG: peptidylprolyl isomerase [Ignavibacteriae bacterium]|nr:peptidylprolyl isomerase [Ignavibacteriota bacterium]